MGLHVTPTQLRGAIASGAPFPYQGGQDEDPLALKAIGTITHFKRNQLIFNEGDAASSAFKLVSGAVRLCKLLPDGRRQIAGFRLAGDFFGLDCEGDYNLTAEALSEVVAVRYARTHLARLEEDRRDVRHRLTALLRRELWAAQAHLIMLGRQTAQERVASFLLQLADRDDTGNGDAIFLPMGRQDIADYLGLTIETVCRAISDLKRRRIIAVPDRNAITLLNLDALQTIADGDE
jgi:CRP-like cAMP-binding protein